MGIFDRLLGRKKSEEFAHQKNQLDMVEKKNKVETDNSLEANIRDMQKWRHKNIGILVWEKEFAENLENMLRTNEECALILEKCNTPKEIIEGFQEATKILRKFDKNDPLAHNIAKINENSYTIDEYYFRTRDDFIRQCIDFMKAGNLTITKELMKS
jgi:hypothetical protein